MRRIFYLVIIAMTVACSEGKENKTEKEEMSEETNSGLIYEVLTQGSGAKIQMGNEIHTHVILTLEDGTEVWTTRNPGGDTFSFVLGQTSLIAGFEEGVLRANEGDRIKLTVPSYLGYGERGSPPDIPPNATLIFDIEIVKVVE